MNWSKENIKKIVLIAAGLIVFHACVKNIAVLWMGLGYLITVSFPFILGSAIAFIINVPMRGIEKHLFPKTNSEKVKNLRRPLALVLTLVLGIGILTAAVVVVIPQVGNTISDVGKQLPKVAQENLDRLEKLLKDRPELLEYVESIDIEKIQIDWDKLVSEALGFAKNGAGKLVNTGINIVSGVVSGAVNFLIAFIFAIYILLQKERLASQVKRIIRAYASEKWANRCIGFVSMSEQIFANFLSGQCLEAVILGVMFLVTMTILRLPYALTVGFVIAITALVPIVGAFAGCFIGAFLILVESPVKALIFLVMFLVLQQIEGNLIYPYVVGGSVGLPSIWVLAAVTIGGNMFGIVGMLIFIPICSIIYVLIRDDVKRRLGNPTEDADSNGDADSDEDADSDD